MRRFQGSLVFAVSFAFTAGALAYDVSKDLKNLGPAAAGITVILCGDEKITQTFDGYPSGQYQGTFGSVSTTSEGGNTKISWSKFDDGDGKIDTDQVVHVGWSTEDGSSLICDMYYTDENGKRIDGSKIENITPKITLTPGGGTNGIFENSNSFNFVVIGDISFGVFAAPLPLAALNVLNEPLNIELIPLGLSSIPLAPGQSWQFPIPAQVPPNGSLVLRYQVTGPGSSTHAMDFVQWTPMVAPPPGCNWDLDGDGVVGQGDLGILLANYGTIFQQPELGAMLAAWGTVCP